MKKFMRIALVFALAGATLMYTGCTKDYSGDISDLNKKVSEQASALSALQTQVAAAQSSASEALSSAQNALKEAQAAAKAAADANNDAEVAALTTKIATIEGNIADLQAKVEALNGLEAKLNEVADQLKKDVDAKVDAALEEIQAELDKALAQIDGAFTIKSANQLSNKVTYKWAKWAPSKKAGEQKLFAKLAEAFPELKDIKKDEVVASCNDVPFIVTPSTIEFDETDSFALVDIDGEDLGWELGAPYASPANVKAGTAGVWFVDVQKPAYKKDGKTFKEGKNLALVVEKANGAIAQTAFDYNVRAREVNVATEPNYKIKAVSCTTDDFKDGAFDLNLKLEEQFNGRLPYADYFIIEPTGKIQIEKYGVSVDGATITVKDLPEKGEPAIDINFQKTVIFLDGRTAQAAFTVNISAGAIAPNAELADQTVTLGYNAKATNPYDVNVDYAVADFGFTALEWDTVFEALNKKATTPLSAERDDEIFSNYNETDDLGTDGYIEFLDKNKVVKSSTKPANGAATVSSEDIAYIRFVIDSQDAIPGEYSVKITDGSVFCAVGNVTVKNPAAKPVKIADKLCENGVLQIVGNVPTNGLIVYDLEDALISTTGAVGTTFTFTDVAYEAAEEVTESQTKVKNWITGGKFQIPIQGNAWDGTATTDATKALKLLYTEREFAVEFEWFTNSANTDTLHFKAQAVSPIWTADGSNITLNTDTKKSGIVSEIYYVGGENKSTSTTLSSGQITGGKYVAGNKKGTTFSISDETDDKDAYWKATAKSAWDLNDTTEVKFTQGITNSNIVAYDSDDAKNTTYLKGTDGLPVSVALVDAYNMGFVTMAFYMSKKDAETPWTYYLTVANWESIHNLYTAITAYGYTCAYGKVNPIIAAGQEIDPDVIKLYAGYADNAYKAYNDTEKAQYNYFTTVITAIDFGEKTETSYTYVPASAGSEMSPAELAEMPFFTFEGDKAEFEKYAKITVNATSKVVSKIEANNDTDPAGRKSVVIPVYANVKDKWGMTTQKKVDITLKVE